MQYTANIRQAVAHMSSTCQRTTIPFRGDGLPREPALHRLPHQRQRRKLLLQT